MEKPVFGILTLDSTVNLYAEIERFISWKLVQEKIQVVQIGCSSALTACTSINSLGKRVIGSPSEQQAICSRCRKSQDRVFSTQVFSIERLFRDAHQLFIDELRTKLLETKHLPSVIDKEFDGYAVCKIAFFDYSILTKTNLQTEMNDELIMRFCNGVRDILILIENLKTFLKQNKIDYLLYINGNYSQNTIARLISKKYAVKCFSIEPQLTSQALFSRVSFLEDRFKLESEMLLKYSNSLATSKNSLQKLLTNFGARIDGADFNAYTSLNGNLTSIGDWLKFNQFLANYSRIHVFFMSSEDELIPHIVAHELPPPFDESYGAPYSNQVEFTTYFIEQAKLHPKIGFLIRMHPRMAVNKRNNFESEEHIRYKKLLERLSIPPNLFILTGDNQLSSYYLISKSDLVIVAWSTIGIEALLMGKRVLSVFPKYLMYPLAKYSRQPVTFKEISHALFGLSEFGEVNQKNFIAWASNAYETQFSPVFARRGSAGILRKLAAGMMMVSGNNLVYRLLASIFSVLNRQTQPMSRNFTTAQFSLISADNCADSEVANLMKEYQEKVDRKLVRYQKNMQKISSKNSQFTHYLGLLHKNNWEK